MHTAEANSEKSAVDLSTSSLRTFREPVLSSDSHNLAFHRLGETGPDREVTAAGSFQKFSDLWADSDPAITDLPPIPRWKRVLDFTCAVLTLPVWLPIFLLIALWVKIVSPGPVFFRQERIGFKGNRFMILKFRTMKVNVETGIHERHLEQLINANVPMTKLDSAGDPRIIAGGRILRATGLDELPQLFNVFRGEMSLVGPRPCTPHEFKNYKVWQQERANALPGLTGFWQVNGKNQTTFTEMVDMDIFYVRNLTLALDLQIMFRTAPAIIVQVIQTRILPRMRAQTVPISQSGKASASGTVG
jgi:lipopolysaccharide/colanic/teichoic acid biosynthesis glycosyltransferase